MSRRAARGEGTTGRFARPQKVVVVDDTDLVAVLARPNLLGYLRALWRRRHFIAADSRARVESSNRANLLGAVWLVLNPLLSGAVYFVIFGLVLRGNRGIENFTAYLIIGVFMFQFTIQCLNQGARSVISGRALIRAFAFPRAALPVAAVLRQTLRFVPVLITMLILVLAVPVIVPMLDPAASPIRFEVTTRWLVFPVVVMLQLVLSTGIALIAARLTAAIPDLTQIISIVSRFWLYGSAVFFSIDRFAQYPALHAVMQVNPMFVVLDIARDLLIYATTPNWSSWALLSAWAVGALVVGTVFFWLGEESYGRDRP